LAPCDQVPRKGFGSANPSLRNGFTAWLWSFHASRMMGVCIFRDFSNWHRTSQDRESGGLIPDGSLLCGFFFPGVFRLFLSRGPFLSLTATSPGGARREVAEELPAYAPPDGQVWLG